MDDSSGVAQRLADVTRKHGDVCIQDGCEVRPATVEDFYFGLLMTDAGWKTVCVEHWMEHAMAGDKVWPPLPSADPDDDD